MNLFRFLTALAALAIVHGAAEAQSRYPLSLQLSGGIVKPFSDENLDGTTGGSLPASVGFEGQIRYSTVGVLSVGAGFQISDLGDYDGSRLSVFFLEPRIRIKTKGGRVGPYLAGRLGIGKISYFDPDDVTTPIDIISKNGASIGGGLGALYQFSPRVGIDLGVLINSAPQPVGSFALARLGLSIGLGRPRTL